MSPTIAHRPTLSPPQLARRLGVSAEKVIAWIRSGKLRAINVSDGPKRPRWRIHQVDVELFEAGRAVIPPAPAARPRRRAAGEVIEFF